MLQEGRAALTTGPYPTLDSRRCSRRESSWHNQRRQQTISSCHHGIAFQACRALAWRVAIARYPAGPEQQGTDTGTPRTVR